MKIQAILIFYLILNVYGYIMMYVDKRRAQNHKWRVPEKRIWAVAVLGGALGLTIGMKQFRHKTKHKNFAVLLPVLAVLTVGVYIFILLNLS